MVMTNIFTANIAYADTEAIFPDTNLHAAIATWLGKTATDSIFLSELQAKLASNGGTLNLQDKDIYSLEGMQIFNTLNLKSLNLNANSMMVGGVPHTNHISDITPLSGITSIQTLELQNASTAPEKITDISPLSGLTNLKQLYINGNSIIDISPLSGLTSLTSLWANGNKIRSIAALSGLTNLNMLVLKSNCITDLSPLNAIKSNLIVFYIGNNDINLFSGSNKTIMDGIPDNSNNLPQYRFGFTNGITGTVSFLNSKVVDNGQTVGLLTSSTQTSNGTTFYAGAAIPGSITYSTSDNTIATINASGQLTGVSEGNCQVTASIFDGSGEYIAHTIDITVNAAPVTGSVTVNHKGSDGTTLDTESFTGLALGDHTYNSKTFSGYTLNGAASQTVTLTAVNLNQTITFNYNKNSSTTVIIPTSTEPTVTGSVTVKHMGSDGATLDTESFTGLALGDHTYNSKTFSGYTLNGAASQTATLTIGNLNQTVTFNYNKNIIQPSTVPATELKPELATEPKPEPVILGIVKGKVLNDNGTPISNVRLEIHSEPQYTYTDKDGYYEFKNVPLGEHTISITDNKFKQKAKNMKELKIVVLVDKKNNVEVKRVSDSDKAFTGITLDK